MYTSARTALGLERANKLIMFCFNDRCRVAKQNDFHMLLETVENLLSDDGKAAEEAVAGLHEAAAEAGGCSSGGIGGKHGCRGQRGVRSGFGCSCCTTSSYIRGVGSC